MHLSTALCTSASSLVFALEVSAMQKSSNVNGDRRNVLENWFNASYISKAGKIKDFSRVMSAEDSGSFIFPVVIMYIYSDYEILLIFLNMYYILYSKTKYREDKEKHVHVRKHGLRNAK